MSKRGKWGQSVFWYMPICQTLTFVLFFWGGGGEGVVWSQGLEYFIKSDWIKSHVCLEGKHLFLLPGRAEIVFV